MACASVRVRCLPVVCLKFLVHAAPWLAGPREAEGVLAGEAGLDLSKEHLRTQELEQRGQLRIPSAFPSSGRGQGEEYAPLSRHHVGNRACAAARPERRHQPTPSLVTGISWGVSGSLTAMRARFRAFQHGQQSQDMTGSACRFWRGLCVRVRVRCLPVVCLKFFGPRRPLARRPA